MSCMQKTEGQINAICKRRNGGRDQERSEAAVTNTCMENCHPLIKKEVEGKKRKRRHKGSTRSHNSHARRFYSAKQCSSFTDAPAPSPITFCPAFLSPSSQCRVPLSVPLLYPILALALSLPLSIHALSLRPYLFLIPS